MKYDIKKRIFLVKKYYELKSCSLVQRAFRTNYKNESVPSHTTITNLISVFEKQVQSHSCPTRERIQVKKE